MFHQLTSKNSNVEVYEFLGSSLPELLCEVALFIAKSGDGGADYSLNQQYDFEQQMHVFFVYVRKY